MYYLIFLLRDWLLSKKPPRYMVEKETNESFVGKSPRREGKRRKRK